MIELTAHFSRDGRSRHSHWLRQQRWFIAAKAKQQRREELAQGLKDELIGLAANVVLATQQQIELFEAKLDTYDEATVMALMENQEKLDVVNAEISALLERAYVLDDGRRVFKTEDGTQVFDEFGEAVGRDALDPDFIRPDQPTWESFAERKALQERLEIERRELLEFQEKIDSARERLAEGDATEADLEQLDADLSVSMPPAVRYHVRGIEDISSTPEANIQFSSSSAGLTVKNELLVASPVSKPNL